MSSEPITAPSPFHAGEWQVQAKLGVSDIEDWARKVVRPYLPDQHREFYAKLPFLVAAARDDQGRPWATLLTGRDGFVRTPDDRTLFIDGKPVPGDALEGALAEGVDLGVLGIEFATRRRNRVNGRIAGNGVALTVSVDQSFGNCPQYIRERAWHWVEDPDAGEPLIGTSLTSGQRNWIGKADTFFIASGHRGEGEDPAFGMDASHRGGDPGFVVVETANRLVFPDYAGNNHYNTIGNLVLDPRVGLLFVDFETGSLLQLSGRAEIDWDSAALADFPGARRLVRIDVEAVIELPRALPLRWESEAESVRSLRLVDRVRESEDVTSFLFEARDGGTLTPFEAGQHLPIELHVTGHEESVRRTYSLSGAPDAGQYRISVKREERGAASRHLHDAVAVGEVIDARKPSGDFVLPCAHCPIVLISAGVGLTPMVSMLHALAAEDGDRPVWFVHGARNGNHHPLKEEVADLARRRDGISIHAAYSQPSSKDRQQGGYDSVGRIDRTLLAKIGAGPEAHYMLCGPVGFMAGVQQDLESLGVHPDNIHSESFGPR